MPKKLVLHIQKKSCVDEIFFNKRSETFAGEARPG